MKKCRFTAVLLAFLFASAYLPPKTVQAEGDKIDSFEIKSYFVMKEDIPTPGITFSYSIAPGRGIAETDDTHEIVPGPDGAAFASSQNTVSFTSDDRAMPEASAPSDSAIVFATPDNDTDEVYLEKTLTVDLSGVRFDSVGIYRYVITQEALNAAGVIPDSTGKRYIDVFVYQSGNAYVPKAVILRANENAPGTDGQSASADKSSGFTNRYETNNLGFSKSVTGNQSSVNKYFRFTVRLTGSIASGSEGTPVIVGGHFDAHPSENMATPYDADVMSAANDVSGYVTLSQLQNGKDFYIKHGQDVILSGIPSGLGYEVTEDPDGYKPLVLAEGDTDCTTDGGAVSDNALTQNTTLEFTNTQSGIIPSTGVTAAFAVPAVFLLAGIAGTVLLAARRLRRIKEG